MLTLPAESFHFCRFFKGEAFLQAVSPGTFNRSVWCSFQLARHEHYLASVMNLRPGMRVLDVGCGVGGPAREIARFSDANIVGINNNEFQVERARRKTAKAGLSDKVSFVKGNFMELSQQFGENSFDASACRKPKLTSTDPQSTPSRPPATPRRSRASTARSTNASSLVVLSVASSSAFAFS